MQTVMKISDNNDKCDINNYDPKLIYCAQDTKKNSFPCTLDQGGPLMYFENGRWYVYGLFSYFNLVNWLCAAPSYFTKVSEFISFIDYVKFELLGYSRPTTTQTIVYSSSSTLLSTNTASFSFTSNNSTEALSTPEETTRSVTKNELETTTTRIKTKTTTKTGKTTSTKLKTSKSTKSKSYLTCQQKPKNFQSRKAFIKQVQEKVFFD